MRFLLLQRGFNVAGQLLKTKIADAYAKVASGHILQFMRLVKDHALNIGEHASIRPAGLAQMTDRQKRDDG